MDDIREFGSVIWMRQAQERSRYKNGDEEAILLQWSDVGPFESTASAPDSAQASLAPRLFFQLRVLCVRTCSGVQTRTEPEAKFKAERKEPMDV